jgi:phosphatidylglycerophosphate synthase
MSAELVLDDVKRAAKREDFRAGVQMCLVMPRVSVRVTHWLLVRSRLSPNQITLASFTIGLGAAVAFATTNPFVVAAGLLVFQLHVLLDYVDGEVARCRGMASVRGAYLDLMADRVTLPLLAFCAAFGAYREMADPTLLVGGFFAAFGVLVDKEACDCWYRANVGTPDIEDRYVAAPNRVGWQRWRGRLALALAMSRGLTAFLTYTAAAGFLDAAGFAPPTSGGNYRALVVWLFAVLMPLGAVSRFVYIYCRGVIPRRQQLLL